MSHLLTLHDPARANQYYRAGLWREDTLYSLAQRHAEQRPSTWALRDNARRLTWREVVDWVDAVAAHLHESGLRAGDRVSVWLPNRLENVIVQLACARQGYVCNPSLHQNYTVAEIVTLLGRIEARALFAQPGWGADQTNVFVAARALTHMRCVYALPPLRTANTENSTSTAIASDITLPAGCHAMPRAANVPVTPTDALASPDAVVYLAFTSGTTGLPKGVMHSHNTLLANGRALVQDWGHSADSIILTLSPMSHHIGTIALEQMLVAGCELVMHDASAGVTALDWIETTGATYVLGVPTHALDLLHELDRRGRQRLGAVRTFYMAGAPIPSEVARRLLELGAMPQNVYGMTENGSHQYTCPHDPVDTITSTCGKSCKGYEVRLWDPEDPDVEAQPGAVGEIGGRGALLMLGYFSNQSATENSFNRSGWFLSGDLGRFDDQGNLMIVGRKKDLIIRGGHNIYPAHIEEYAHRHPQVKKVAAFGVPDERLGEKVCLALIAHEALLAQDMLAHLAREGLSKFDMPEYYIVMDEFPLTASGKILKRELIEWFKAGRIQPTPARYRPPST